MDYQEFEKYCNEDVEMTQEVSDYIKAKESKRRMKTVGLFAIGVSAAYLYGKSKGFDIGFDIGELQGYKEAATSIMEGSVDAFNLGRLEE